MEKDKCNHDWVHHEFLDRAIPPLDVYKCTKCGEELEEEREED